MDGVDLDWSAADAIEWVWADSGSDAGWATRWRGAGTRGRRAAGHRAARP
jgi:hypothetical protein